MEEPESDIQRNCTRNGRAVEQFMTLRTRKAIPRKREKPRTRRAERTARPKDSRKPGSVVLLSGEAYEAFREAIWQRDGHRCVWCGKWVPLEADSPFVKMDLMHHPRSRPKGGDVPENAVCSCHECHMKSHNGWKPVPAKR